MRFALSLYCVDGLIAGDERETIAGSLSHCSKLPKRPTSMEAWSHVALLVWGLMSLIRSELCAWEYYA